MKKSIGTKIAVLGAIGVMTLAGTGSALAADNGAQGDSTEYMSEHDALARMDLAEHQGTVISKADNTEMIRIGSNTYTYSFTKTEEKNVRSGVCLTVQDAEKKAEAYAADTDLMLHDIDVKQYRAWAFGDGAIYYYAEGKQYFGNLDISRVKVSSISLSQDKDTILSDGSDSVELTYSVNELACADDVKFESDNNSVATVEKFGDKAYVVGHKQGSVLITATAGSAEEHVWVDVVDVMPQ